MSAIIYNRVSSPMQNTYGKTVSLAMQESICNKFAQSNKLRVNQIMKEIRSASGKSSPILKQLVETPRNKVILFMDVSRFSRNVEQGLALASRAIINGIKLVFVHEKFACITAADLPRMKTLIAKTEDESKVIGVRIATAKRHRRDQGLHPGGYVPYGYELRMSDMGNRPVPNAEEQKIISFIQLCKADLVKSNDLNIHMKTMVSAGVLKDYTNIDCYDVKGDRVTAIDGMHDISIAELLNEYMITKRGRVWSSASIKTAMNGATYIYKPEIDVINRDVPAGRSKTSFNFRSFTDDLDDIDEPPKKRTTNQRSSGAVRNNNMDSDDSDEPVPARTRAQSTDSNDSTSDIALFTEFKAFKKLMKKKKKK
jgi:DNA invertase Pin-like site-specific DNA recombinase